MTPYQWLASFVVCHPDHVDVQAILRISRNRLSPSTVRVAAWAASQADPATLEFTQRQVDIASALGVQQAQVSSALRRLVDTGWLEVVRRRRGFDGATVYRLTTPVGFWDEYVGLLQTKALNSPRWGAMASLKLKELRCGECPFASGEAGTPSTPERPATVRAGVPAGVPA